MGAIEDLVQLFAGNDVQKTIAAENPYLQGANTVDQVGQVVQQAAGTGKYGLGELGVGSAITGLLSGLLSGAGGNYQNTLTSRYNDTLAKLQGGQAVEAESTGLPANIFQKADTNARLFKKVQELQDQQKEKDIAAEIKLRTNRDLLKADAITSAVKTGEIGLDEGLALLDEKPADAGAIENAVAAGTQPAGRIPVKLRKEANEELANLGALEKSLEFVDEGFKAAKDLVGGPGALLSQFTGISTYGGDKIGGLADSMMFQADKIMGREINSDARKRLLALTPKAYDTPDVLESKQAQFKDFLASLAKSTPILDATGISAAIKKPIETPKPKLKASDLIAQGYKQTANGWVK